MDNINYKRIVAFTKDEAVTTLLTEWLTGGHVSAYPYDAKLEEINFDNSVVLFDHDAEGVDTSSLLLSVVKAAGPDTKVLVVSKNCDRKNVTDCARKGAARFIVKPLNKKRLKRFVLPYLTIRTEETGSTVSL